MDENRLNINEPVRGEPATSDFSIGPVDIETEYDQLIALWQNAGLPCKPYGRDHHRSMQKELHRPDTTLLVARHHERIIASILITSDGRKGWLNRIAVHPDHRGQGYAKRLIREGELVLRRLGVPVYAMLIESDNAASLAMARSTGYVEHRDIVYLTKRISPDS